MNELISVIIPVYNVERYLNACIDSVLCQTYKDIEIILVDDGAADGCPDICDAYAKADSRVRVIHKQNGGLSDARNAGIDTAKGKYLLFIDSDDSVSPDHIEYLYRLLTENRADMSVCGVMQVQEGKSPVPSLHTRSVLLTPERAFFSLLYAKGVDVCAYAKLYKAELFDGIRFPKGRVYEDSATTYRILDRCRTIAYGDKKSYYYFTRPGSISKMGAFNKNEYDFIEHTSQMLDYITAKYPSLSAAADRYYLYSKFRTLRMVAFTKPRNRAFEKRLTDDIKSKRRSVFFDKNTPRRDKLAIAVSFFGIGAYRLSWYLYTVFTGRML